MITPIDCICLQMIQAANRVDEAHYHLTDPPHFHPHNAGRSHLRHYRKGGFLKQKLALIIIQI